METEHQPESSTDTEQTCDHDWTLVNRDENRLIYKCTACGELRRE